MKQQIVLCGGKRTPFGDFGKSLAAVTGTDLGIHAARACLTALDLDPARVDHTVCGNVIPVDQGGYFSARVIGLGAGLAETSRALNVSRACGSGTQAIVSAAEHRSSPATAASPLPAATRTPRAPPTP